jgi:hypothetical protein
VAKKFETVAESDRSGEADQTTASAEREEAGLARRLTEIRERNKRLATQFAIDAAYHRREDLRESFAYGRTAWSTKAKLPCQTPASVPVLDHPAAAFSRIAATLRPL